MITEHSDSKRVLDLALVREIEIPNRGPFNVPNPYNVRVVRVTNEDDGLINSVGYSYWPNVQVNDTYLNVFIGTNNRIELFRINRQTLNIVNQLNHKLPFHTGEGWFWSREKDWLYFYESWGRTLKKYDVSTGEIKDIFTVEEDHYIWQLHASADERVFSFTLRKKPDLVICPAVYINGKVHKFDLRQAYDECQISKSGTYLMIKEGDINRIINLHDNTEQVISNRQGALGHSDMGFDIAIGEEDVTQPGGVIRLFDLDSMESKVIYHMDWTAMSRHVSYTGKSNFALVSSAHPDNLPRANELVLITLDGSLNCHVLCPSLNTGTAYDDLPKANLTYDGNYAAWTAKINGRRDLFIVEIASPDSIPIKPKEENKPMSEPKYDEFVFDEIRRIGQAWFDKNPQDWMSGISDDQKKFLFEKVGEMSWRRLIDGKSVHTILEEIGVNPADYGEPNENPNPPISNLTDYSRYGMSIAAMLVDTNHNIEETVKRFVDAGVSSTRINLLSALWDNQYGKVNCLPYHQLPDGRWDLFAWNQQYFERLAEIKERMNSNGIVIQWTNYELYSWSDRKKGSQQDNTPWRNNINGIYWKSDDSMFDIFPNDGFSIEWFEQVCPLLSLEVNPFEVGNEYPEKALHERVTDEVKRIVPEAYLQVNRNDDKPGQYENMKIGKNYDFLSHHGRKLKTLGGNGIISDLERKDGYEDEPKYKTFQQFIDKCPHDKERVIFSSDGARISDDPVNTYDWNKLGEFFDHMIDLGYNIEHQSRAKMTPAPNHEMIEVDWFLQRVNNR